MSFKLPVTLRNRNARAFSGGKKKKIKSLLSSRIRSGQMRDFTRMKAREKYRDVKEQLVPHHPSNMVEQVI